MLVELKLISAAQIWLDYQPETTSIFSFYRVLSQKHISGHVLSIL